jgi:4-carboxymuconolactone decarboxylase
MRLPAIAPEAMTPAQRAVHDATVAGPRGRMVPPVAAWLHSPGVAGPAQMLGRHIRYESSLPLAWNEMAILLVARHWGASYEWYAHKRMALEAGLAPAVVAAILAGETPALPPEAAVIFDYAMSLLVKRNVSAGQHEAMVAHWGTKGVVDLVALLGYYTLVSMTLNAFDVGLPPGEAAEVTPQSA